jgi:hypothetical protein
MGTVLVFWEYLDYIPSARSTALLCQKETHNLSKSKVYLRDIGKMG